MLHKCYTVPDTHNMHLFYENDKLSIALLQLSKHVLECKKKKNNHPKMVTLAQIYRMHLVSHECVLV